MKRKYRIIPLLCLLLCLSLFAGCAGKNPPSLRDGDNIVYPGVQWFCSPQELLDALKLTQNDVTIRDDTTATGGQYEILAKGLKLFGDEAGVIFLFSKSNDTILRLTQIEARYDETVDMAAIREKVESSLGAPTEEPVDYSGHLAYWDSEATITTPDGTKTFPASRLSWLDDLRLRTPGAADAGVNLVKAGVLTFVGVYVPNGKSSSDVHSDVMTDAPLPQWLIPDDFEINRTLSEIRVYPFTEEEIADARKAAETAIYTQYPSSIVTINKLAFDPALTDANIRQQLDDAGSLENEDHAYASQITFAVECLVQVLKDVPNSPPSPNGKTVQITVCRADTSSSWEYLNGSYSTESGRYSSQALRNTDLWPLKDLVPGRLIAGYTHNNFKYDLYYVDANGQVVFADNVQTELQRSGTPVDAATLATLQELFGGYTSWYSQALTSEYSRPEDVDLGMLFYRGVPLDSSSVEPTADEVSELAKLSVMWSSENTCDLPTQRISTAQMNEILEQYFGISLDETTGNGLDWLTYLEDTDCYYTRHSSTNAISPEITAAYLLEDGTIAMYYMESRIIGNSLAILKPVGDGYQILSNKAINS